jgi:hypothetical protein
MTYYQSTLSEYLRELNKSLPQPPVDSIYTQDECSQLNPCYLCRNPEPEPEPVAEPELPKLPTLSSQPTVTDNTTQLIALLKAKNKKLKSKNKKLKSKNKKLKSKNKKLKKELDRAYKQEVKDMNEIKRLEDLIETCQQVIVSETEENETQKLSVEDPDYEPETESESETEFEDINEIQHLKEKIESEGDQEAATAAEMVQCRKDRGGNTIVVRDGDTEWILPRWMAEFC